MAKTNEQKNSVQKESLDQSLFDKQALINSDKYKDKQDLLTALLTQGCLYSLEQTDKLIEDFMKGGK